MKVLWNGFHQGLDTSAALLLLCLALLTGVVLMGIPALLCWLLCETGNRVCNVLMRKQKQPEVQADNQDFTEHYSDLWQIGKQYDPPVQFDSIEARRLFQFASTFTFADDDLCLGHVEEDAS